MKTLIVLVLLFDGTLLQEKVILPVKTDVYSCLNYGEMYVESITTYKQFKTNNRNGLSSLCIPCDRLRGRVYKYKNATTLRNSDNKYINTEVGYQHDIINGIFSRGRKDPSKTKRFIWVPEITKEKIYE